MATDHDVAFLRQLIRQGLLDPAQATRCIEAADDHPEQTIAQVVGGLGLVDAARLNEVVAALDVGLGPGPAAPGPAAPGTEDEPVVEGWVDLARQGSPELAPFEMARKLGRGPVGTAYAGRRKADGAEVVVKVLSHRFHAHADLLARVLADLRAFVGVRVAHAGETLAVGTLRDRHAVVFQRLPGETLADEVRRRRRFPPQEATRVAWQVAQALAELHARGLACGDVRASKVYVGDRGAGATLADLGLARAACAAAGFARHRLAFGHPAYLAPELRAVAQAPTPAGDVYALGVLLYECLCGRLPFQGTPDEMLRLHADAALPPPPPSAGVSVALAGVLLRTTAKLPQSRPDAAGLARTLQSLAEHAPAAAVAAAPMSAGEWSKASQEEVQTRSGVWSLGRITQAAALGPRAPSLPAPGQSARFTRSWGASVLMKAATLEDIGEAPAAPAAPAGPAPLVAPSVPVAPSAARLTGGSERTLKFEAVLRPSGRHAKPATGEPLRLLLEEGGQVKVLDVVGDELTIGRTGENAVKVADAQSSRRHCRLRRGPGGWLVEDLESRNGTKLNGVAIAGERPLSPGDRIQIGDSIVHFKERAEAPWAAPAPAVAPPPSDASRPVMRVVGDLAVGERLGGGPVGTTYDGTLEGRRAAVKVVSTRFAAQPEVVARLLERVRAAAQLEHPHVVRVLQVAEYEGRTVIVTERHPGNSLRETLAFEKRLGVEEAADRVHELAGALEAAAARGLHHGDVRPAKVLLDAAGRACLSDFGLAEAACLAGGFGALGLPFGHPVYLAPEVLQERLAAPTARTDVYALGVLFYELITGQPPFRGARPQDVLAQHLEAAVPPPPQDVEVPRPLAEVLLRMLAKDPARRPASAAEVRELLARRAAGPAPTPARPAQLPEGSLRTTTEADEFDPRRTLVSSGEWSTLAESASSERVDPPSPPSGTRIAPVAPRDLAGTALASNRLAGTLSGETPVVVTPAAAPAATVRAVAAATVKAAPAATARALGRVDAEPASTASGSGAGDVAAASSVPNAQAYRRRLAAVWGAAGVSLVVLLVVALRSPGGGAPTGVAPRTDVPPAATATAAPPPGSTPAPTDREARLARALEDHRGLLQEAVGRGDFARALELQRDIESELRDWPGARERLDAAAAQLQGMIRTAVGAQLRDVDALLLSGQLERAERAVERLRPFGLEDPAFAELARRVQQAARAWRQPLEALRPERPFERRALSDALAGLNLRAWPRRTELLDNGAVIVRYGAEDTSALGDDLTYLKGSRGPQDSQGVRFDATAPVLVALELPFARLLDAHAELELLSEPAAGSRVVLLAGLSEAPERRAHGLAWGISPVQLDEGLLKVVTTRGLPRLPAQRPLRLELRVGSAGQPGRSFVSGALLDVEGRTRSEGGRGEAADKELRGWVGLYLENVEVRLQGLELRGLLDVAALGP